MMTAAYCNDVNEQNSLAAIEGHNDSMDRIFL